MKKTKLLMVSGNGSPIICGISDYTANLLQTLHHLYTDWDLTWVCRKPRWFNSPISSYRGLRMIRPNHAWNSLGIELTTTVVRQLKPDLIHIQDQIHSYFETDAAVQIARVAKCPVVVTLHEFHDELPSVKYTMKLVKLADKIIANDARISDRCQEYTQRIPDLKGWSPTNILPGKSKENVDKISGLLTSFGLISRIKQLPVVFEALQNLRQQGLNIKWRIIGPFNPTSDSYHSELAQQFNVPWVEFTGGFNDINDRRLQNLLAETEAMILPFADGASIRRGSLQAAWAFGLPVITTTPSITDPEIQNGVNCLLVQESTPQAWSDTIQKLLQNYELKEQLRIGSLEVAKHFSWQKLAHLHWELYDNLLRKNEQI